MNTFTLTPEFSGERLDHFLAAVIPQTSRSHLQRLISGGAVLVNGAAVSKNHRMTTGDIVTVAELATEPSTLEPQDLPISVLYEDDCLIVIDKPAGLVVHPGAANRSGTLVNALLFHRTGNLSEGSHPERPGIVHRLDKDTSGVLLVAKTDAAHRALATAFASRTVKKRYLGFCIGTPKPDAGSIDLPLGRSRKDPTRQIPVLNGKASLTEYRVVESRSGISLVRFMPHTGRTHQIRVHCSSRGFPILGDELYGGGRSRLMQIAPLDRPFAASVFNCFSRQALHAEEISFAHPISGAGMTISSPLPADFQKALSLMQSRG